MWCGPAIKNLTQHNSVSTLFSVAVRQSAKTTRRNRFPACCYPSNRLLLFLFPFVLFFFFCCCPCPIFFRALRILFYARFVKKPRRRNSYRLAILVTLLRGRDFKKRERRGKLNFRRTSPPPPTHTGVQTLYFSGWKWSSVLNLSITLTASSYCAAVIKSRWKQLVVLLTLYKQRLISPRVLCPRLHLINFLMLLVSFFCDRLIILATVLIRRVYLSYSYI